MEPVINIRKRGNRWRVTGKNPGAKKGISTWAYSFESAERKKAMIAVQLKETKYYPNA